MGLRKFLSYTVIPASVGAALGYVAQQMGYDISPIEGAKQLFLSGLPFAALETVRIRRRNDPVLTPTPDYDDAASKHPYSLPLIIGGIEAAALSLGGLGMEWLTNTDMNNGFIAVGGAVDGLIQGGFTSVCAIRRLSKRSQ